MDARQVSGLARAFLLELISMGEDIELSTVLRPDNVIITPESIRLKDPMPSAAFVPVDGFAAPEQYVAGNCEKAPIYFMGALMYTLLHGAPPPPVRNRLNKGEAPVNGGTELDRVILHCLEMHPDDRYANLSFVLDALKQVDGIDGSVELVQSLEKSPVGEEIKPPKKTKKNVFIVALVAVLLAAAVLAYTLIQGNRAEKALENGEYGTVVGILNSVPWLKSSRSESYRYATGMQLWEQGSYDQALGIFEELAGYADSAELVKQVRYGKALSMLQARQLEAAQGLFGELGDYADSAAQSQAIAAYREAEAMEDPLARYQAFAGFGEYLDSPSLARAAGEEAYGLAMVSYKAGDIAAAESQFLALGNYGDAPVYQQICALWTAASDSAEENRVALASVMAYSGVADLEPVLMSDRFFMVFLEGSWASNDGGGEMEFTEDRFRTPLLGTAGARWAFQSRAITNGANTVAVFGYLSPNEITMTVSATGETFTYQRAV